MLIPLSLKCAKCTLIFQFHEFSDFFWNNGINISTTVLSEESTKVLGRGRGWALGDRALAHSVTQANKPSYCVSRSAEAFCTCSEALLPPPLPPYTRHLPGLLHLHLLRGHVSGSPGNLSDCAIDQVFLNKYWEKKKKKHQMHIHTQEGNVL